MRKIGLICLVATTLLWGASLFDRPGLAQRIVNVNPSLNSQNVSPDTAISGVFKRADGAAIDLKSVKIFLDGNDITNRSTITRDFFSYRPERSLSEGSHSVRIEYTNNRGQNRTVSWDFTVARPKPAVTITSVTHNAVGKVLGPDATFLATINGTANARGSILLVQDGKNVRQFRAEEVSPGVYVATVNVGKREQIQEGIVIGRLQSQNQITYGVATEGFAFSPRGSSGEVPPVGGGEITRPLQPTFTSHKNRDTIATSGFILTGQTQPNASVAIQVISELPILGGLISARNTLVDETVQADSNGNFQVEVPRPPSLTRGLRYTIRAVASNQSQKSQPVQLVLFQE